MKQQLSSIYGNKKSIFSTIKLRGYIPHALMFSTIIFLFSSIVYDATRDIVYDTNVITEVHTCIKGKCLVTIDDMKDIEVSFPVRVGSEIVSHCKVKRGKLVSNCMDYRYTVASGKLNPSYIHVDDYHIDLDWSNR